MLTGKSTTYQRGIPERGVQVALVALAVELDDPSAQSSLAREVV